MLCALLIHEAGHLIASRIAGEKIAQLELTPFGGVMRYACGAVCHKGIKGVCVHAAGPLSNYIMLSGMLIFRSLPDHAFVRTLMTANLSMLVLNLLPVLPLDGGRIVFCIGYYFFPVATLVSVLSILGMITGAGLASLALYGLVFRGILNCSLLIIGIHIFCCAKCDQSVMLAENIYTVVQERMNHPTSIRRIADYQVSPDVPLFSLIHLMQEPCLHRFVFFHQGREYTLSEDMICSFLLKTPSATIAEAFFSQEQNEEKKPENSFTSCNIAPGDIQ